MTAKIAKIHEHAYIRRNTAHNVLVVTIQASLYIRFEHTIQFNSHGRITYENMSRGYCSFLSLVRDPTDVALSKNAVPRDRSRGGRKSDLNLFISKFSSLTDCPLIHWPSQLKSTGLIDGFASIRKNIRSYVCTGSDPGPTLLYGRNHAAASAPITNDNGFSLRFTSVGRSHFAATITAYMTLLSLSTCVWTS